MRSYQRLKQFSKVFLWILLLGLTVYGLDRWNNRITDGFSHEAILGPFPPYEEGHLSKLTAEERAHVESLFSQPFRYFAKGAQCFALESHDGTYVLKCFKQKHLRKTPTLEFLEQLPILNAYAEQRLKRRRQRCAMMVVGCHVAYNRLREATGILYMHLAPTQDLPPIRIIDYRGVIKEMDPNQFPFYLQKKGSMLREGFLSYRHNGDLEGAKQALHALFEYLAHCRECEVLDADPGYVHNLGWIDGKGTNLDLGKLVVVKDPARLYETHARHVAILRTFFEKDYPELLQTYDEEAGAFQAVQIPT